MNSSPPVKTYAPAVLLIEDDRPAREYYRDKFCDETSLGVVVAKDLKEARRLLESPTIQIDAIVADLFFEFEKDDPDAGLHDGLDILRYGADTHPSAIQYVNSFWADRGEYVSKAKALELPIKAWFSKQFRLPGDTEAPWAQVERDLIEARLLQDEEWSQRGDLPPHLNTVTDAIRRVICPTRRTYIQELGDKRFSIIQPIEVLCWRVADGGYHASAYRLGLLTEGTGDSVKEALERLQELLIEQRVALRDESGNSDGYAGFVRARFDEFIQFVGDVET
jgi:hypothetical protein